MEKLESKNKFALQWETHPKHTFKSLCSLMEHQSMVDIAICCGNNTLHAHKCILAASSPYFREELEKNSAIEQLILTGFDFAVTKSLIEFMYCGETIIDEEHIKYLIAAAKLFQVRGLDILFSDRQEYHSLADDVYIPYPQFVTSKPKYPMAYHPFTNASVSGNILKPINYSMNDLYNQRKLKRKYIRTEAEKACAKEAQASRMALAHLQKEIASTPRVNSFIIEESCTETTVENFIPHTDEQFDNLNGIQQVQVVNYADLEGNIYNAANSFMEDTKPPNLLQFGTQGPTNNPQPQELTADKIKHILGSEIPSNVEIMFKTSEGNYVTVTDEVLQNISKGGLQYQVVDENGHVGEVQDLRVLERIASDKVDNAAPSDIMKDILKFSKMGESSTTAIISEIDPLNVNKSIASDFLNSKLISGSTNQSEGVLNLNKDIQQGLSNFTLNNSNLFPKEAMERKSVDYMLLNNPDFVNPGSGSKLTFYTDNILGDAIESKKVAMKNNDCENIEVVENKLRENENKKFSPDIFFADLTIDHNKNNQEGQNKGQNISETAKNLN